MRNIRIIEPGPLATVQDRGRFGRRSFGVPLSGAMDSQALRVGNLLVGNDDGAASIECTLGGLALEFQFQGHFALTGAPRLSRLNGAPVEMWQAHPVKEGDVLQVASGGTGLRTYLSVSGGFDVPPVMGSRSTYLRGGFGGLDGRALRPGDSLPVGIPVETARAAPAPHALIPPYSPEPVLRVIPGPQDDRVSPGGRALFFSRQYEVTPKTDRMGISLLGAPLELPYGADIISDGTCPGAVQVHGNGQPTILGMDCQTTGGYLKIAVVISSDLPLAAQTAPGDRVRFEEVSLWEARESYMKNEFLIRNLRR